jgi:subtilisin family serine protease
MQLIARHNFLVRWFFALSSIFLLPANFVYSQQVEPDGPAVPESSYRTQPGTRFVPGRVLVLFDPASDEAEAERVVSVHGGRTVSRDPRLGLRVVELAAGVDEMGAVRALRGRHGVLAAELDEIVPLSQAVTPNDPQYGSQAHLRAINAPMAWSRTTGSPSVVVAVIDTGVNGDHPDLAGRLVPGWNTYDNNANYADVYGHGTKVAGTVTTATNNGIGVASICWDCMIMPIRASQPTGGATLSALAAGLTWAADHGARVANISYQVSGSSTVTAAAQYFMQKGGLVFSSAGNYSTNDPAPDNPSIVTVSGVDPATNSLYSWSNYGNNIDVTAPGCAGMTTTMTLGYGGGCGTSFASPIAAGVAALVYSVNPNLTPAQVLDILKQSAIDIGTTGWDIRFGAGMVDADAAVAMASGTSTTDTRGPTVSIGAPVNAATLSGAVAASATVSDAEGSVASVEFRVGATTVCSFTTGPYSCSVDTTKFSDATTTFSVVARDNSNNVTTAQIAITIRNADAIKPVVNLTAPAAGATVSGTATVAFAATDNLGVTGITVTVGSATICSVAGTATGCAWNTTATPNGPAVLTVTARDAAGNTQAASVSVTVSNADTTLPTATILSPSEGATVGRPVTIKFTVSDNIGVTSTVVTARGVTVCSVAGPATSCVWNAPAGQDGPAVISVTAQDAVGNSKTDTVNVTVSATDTTSPAVQIISPVSGGIYSGDIKINFSATDDVGVTSITVEVQSTVICTLPAGATSCTWNSALLNDGLRRATVTATDAAGNVGSATVGFQTKNPDTMKPAVSITNPAAGATVSGALDITFTASDNFGVTGITVAVGSSTICSLSGTAKSCLWNSALAPNGATTITVTARDAVGNSQSDSRSVTVNNADKTAPTVSITAPAASATVSGQTTIGFSAMDQVGVTGITVSVGTTTICTLAGTATSCAWDTTKTPNGLQTITVTARDAAGNSQSAARSVTVDNPVVDQTKPTVSFTTPLAGKTISGLVTVGMTSSDNVKVVRLVLTVNGLTICSLTSASGSCTWNTLNSPNGGLTLTATAYDAAGNAGTAQAVVTVANLDAVKPMVAFVAPMSGVVSGEVNLQVSASDNVGVANVMVTYDGKPLCNLGGSVYSCIFNSALFANGDYTLTATARDGAGNAGTANLRISIQNVAPSNSTDTIKPMTVIKWPTAGSLLKGLVTVSYAAYENKALKGVVVRVDSLTICSLTIASGACTLDTTKFADGLYNIVVQAYDAANNTAMSYIQVRIANSSVPSDVPQTLDPPTLEELDSEVELEPEPDPETDPESPGVPEEPVEPPQG